MNTTPQTEYPEYDAWETDRTPDNMAAVLHKLDPVLVSEVQRYQGPKEVLYTQARQLAIKAVRTYDPTRGASLRTWLTTQLQPLTRYSMHLKPIRVPEEAARHSAELHRHELEWQDVHGRLPTDDELSDVANIPVAKIQRIRQQVRPQLSESQLLTRVNEDSGATLPAISRTNSMDAAQEGVYQDLNPQEQLIFDWRTGKHGQKQLENQEIAARLKVTPALTSQIGKRIAKRIGEVSRGI